jgi:MHS family proline/betaine transporter-like MFS transporter
LLLAGFGALAVLAWPLFWLLSQPSLPVILVGLAGFGLIAACFAGTMPAFMVEAFPKHVRCSGLSVGYNLALSIFGGTVPMVAVALIATTGDRLAPAFYLALAGVVSFIMTSLIHAHPDEARPA